MAQRLKIYIYKRNCIKLEGMSSLKPSPLPADALPPQPSHQHI